MRILNIKVGNPVAVINLGRQGEHQATAIIFDCSHFSKNFGAGHAELVNVSGKGTEYPVVLNREDDKYVWIVSAADTAESGTGKCELRWYAGDTLAKSTIYSTIVMASIAGEGEEPPEPVNEWLDAANRKLAGLIQQQLRKSRQGSKETRLTRLM